MIIIAYKPGQLANSLFKYSKFIAFHLEYGVTIKNPAFYQYLNYFEKTNKHSIAEYPVNKKVIHINFLLKQRYLFWYYTARILHLLNINNRYFKCIYLDWLQSMDIVENHKLFVGKLVLVKGWEFNARNLVLKYRDQIIEYFKPIELHSENIRLFISLIKSDMVKVGIHIRHGDYKTFEGGKYFYSFDVYQKLMNQMVKLNPNKNIQFIICSNVIIDPVIFSNYQFVFGPGHELEDMLVLSECDYIIGPPSTYTIWASYYGNKPLAMIDNKDLDLQLSDFKIYQQLND
jgi:hypothetical protein